jgi:hypothetical protein
MTINGHGKKVETTSRFQEFMQTAVPDQLEMFKLYVERRIEESGGSYGTDEAPWTPVPLKAARDFIDADETRALEMVFPTVYEEDRTAKIKDLATAQGLDYASHRWTAEQVAQELGREEFDYDAELDEIRKERVTLPPPEVAATNVGMGGTAAAKSLFVKGGTLGSPTGAAKPLEIPGGSGPDATQDQPQHRDQVSGPVVAQFKKSQKQSNRMMRAVTDSMTRMTETMSIMARRLIEFDRPQQRIELPAEKIEIHSPPVTVIMPEQRDPQVMPAPQVTFTPPAQKPRLFEVTERDEHGLIKKLKEVIEPTEPASGPADPH